MAHHQCIGPVYQVRHAATGHCRIEDLHRHAQQCVFIFGGIPELVEHKVNGYIAEYKDANDIKSGMEYLLNLSSQESEKMSRYSIEKIKNGFTVEKMTEQYIDLYEKIKTDF